MTDTIREAAARAAEKWRMPPGHSKHDFGHIGFVAGYLAGYEAAKAEAAERTEERDRFAVLIVAERELTQKAREERDAARRMVCESRSYLDHPASGQAGYMGWSYLYEEKKG